MGLPAAVEMQAEIQRVKGLYEAACAAAGDEEGDDPLFATPDEGFGMEADDEGKKVKIKKLHKRVFDAIQLKRAAAQLKRAVEILAVDPKDYRALSYVAARAMMDGKDEQKWGANHARRASRSAKPTLDPGAVSRSAGPCS